MAKIEITLEAVDNASGQIKGLASSIGGLGDLVGGAVSHAFGNLLSDAIGGATAALGDFFTGALDAERIMAQTEAVIKSTGGAAGISAEAISDMATAISKNSTFADDAVQKGENLLLTFTNIGKDVFPQATQAMADMAAAMGTDVSSGAIQLGKALNDPVAGISALSRVGVTFTDDQKKVIESLVKTGDVAGAQKIILAELNKEFGGSAAAQADTFGGKIENLKNQLSNMGEGVVGAVLPGLTTLIDKVMMPALPLVESLAAQAGNLAAAFLASSDPIGQATAVLGVLQSSLQPVIDAALNLGAAFGQSMPMIQTYVNDMVNFVQGLIAQFAPTIVANVSDALNQMAEFWRAHGDEVMAVIDFAFRVIATTIGTTITLISGYLSAGMTAFTGVWEAGTQILEGDWSGAWATIQAAGLEAWETIKATFTSALNGILSIVGTDLDTFVSVWSGVFDQVKTIAGVAWDALVSGAANMLAGLLLTFNTAVANVKAVWDLDWSAIGKGIVDGIISGVSGAASNLAAVAAQAGADALAAIKRALGIHSPSAAFAAVGRQMMAGMSMGISDNAPGMMRHTQAAAYGALAAAGNVTNRNSTFNVYNYGTSAEENTARLRALAGAF